MTFPQLKQQLVSCITIDVQEKDLLHLDLSKGWDVSIAAMAADYFPGSIFSFRAINGQSLSNIADSISFAPGSEINFTVAGEYYPFKNLHADITFKLDYGIPVLIIKSIVDTKKLSAGFPVFNNSLADDLVLDALSFELRSDRQNDEYKSLFSISSLLNVKNTTGGLDDLLGIPSTVNMDGYAWLEKGGSLFYGTRIFCDFEKKIEKKIGGIFLVSLSRIGITDESIYSYIDDAYFTHPFLIIDAVFTIKETPVPLGIEIYNFESDILFKADVSKVLSLGIDELESFIDSGKDSFSQGVPAEIKKALSSIQLEEFGFFANPVSKKINRIYGGVQFDAKLDLSPYLPDKQDSVFIALSRFHFELLGQSKIPEITIEGAIQLVSGVIEVQLEKNNTGYVVTGWLQEDTQLKFSEIISTFSGQQLSFPELPVNKLDFSFVKDGDQTSWDFDIELKGALPIPFNNPVLTLWQVDFALGSSGNCNLSAAFSIGAVDIALSADKEGAGWIFEGSTGLNQQIPLGEFIDMLWDKLLPGAAEHKLPDAIANLVAENIDITIDTSSGLTFSAGLTVSGTKTVNEEYEINEDPNAKWKPSAHHGFEFENLVLKVERSANIQFSAEATFKVSDIEFDVKAGYNDGWDFSATMEGQKKLSDLFDAFKFEKNTVPDSLKEILFGDIALSFNAKTGDKHFSCRGVFESDSLKADLVLNVDVVKTNSGTTDISFAGHLEIIPDETKQDDKLLFDIVFDKDGDGKTLVAAFHDETNKGLTLGGLLKSFGITGADDLSIGIKDVYFVKQGSKSLLHTDVDASLNLSGLPLIGKIFPPGKSVSLELKLLYASGDFSDDEITGINKKLVPLGLAQIEVAKDDAGKMSVKRGPQFTGKLMVADTAYILGLPADFAKDVKASRAALPAAANSSYSTASADMPVYSDQVDGIKWINIHKKMAVINFNRIGVAYKDSKFYIFPDASLDVGALSLSLDGLGLSAKLNPFVLDFYLKGLSLDFNNGAVEIGAAFLRQSINGVDEYNGLALIKTAKLSITAMGSYSRDSQGNNSLFIYAYLNQALGGPGFFFVEGLAAAFGYNRSLVMPAVSEVANFPLVRQVMDTQPQDAGADKAAFLSQQLSSMARYVPASVGNMFLAVGIKFNSFKLIDSFVLLAVSFGNHFEIDVLGQSNITVPAMAKEKGVTPLAEIKILLVARFQPDEGILAVRAQLSNDSYIISRNCRLTGGAAFYSWFKGEHEGDFVVTMGGYHPAFNVPAHYPQVPRLELNWQVSAELAIKGDMYFALCAHAFMAGGHLQALYTDGPLQAWFNAGADFLVTWQPYHYDARIYVNIGASYTYHFFGTHHISIDVGADVHIWGPEFAGTAEIDLWITSVTVSFGPQGNAAPVPIGWNEFITKCIPAREKICSVDVIKGQHAEKIKNEKKIHIVNPKELEVSIASAVPLNNISYRNSEDSAGHLKVDNGGEIIYPFFGISPMGDNKTAVSTHTICIKRDGVILDSNDFNFTVNTKSVPAAIWGTSFLHGLNEKNQSIKTVSGLTFKPKPQEAKGRLELKNSIEIISLDYPWYKDEQRLIIAPDDNWDAFFA